MKTSGDLETNTYLVQSQGDLLQIGLQPEQFGFFSPSVLKIKLQKAH